LRKLAGAAGGGWGGLERGACRWDEAAHPGLYIAIDVQNNVSHNRILIAGGELTRLALYEIAVLVR
jgi:hypothetical protein